MDAGPDSSAGEGVFLGSEVLESLNVWGVWQLARACYGPSTVRLSRGQMLAGERLPLRRCEPLCVYRCSKNFHRLGLGTRIVF